MQRARIFNVTMPVEFVEFDLNPNSIRMSKSSLNATRGSASPGAGKPAGSISFFRATMPTELVGKAMLVGADTKNRADQLLTWLQPGGGLLGRVGGAVIGAAVSAGGGGRVNLTTKQPTLTFQWGPPVTGFSMLCVLKSCNIEFTRFESSGTPVHAEVRFTLTEKPNPLSILPTNPSSGGRPGRQQHTVVDGESLASISTARYGTPSLWRAIASLNGIDNPLRVRPGDTVLLPAPDDLLEDTDRTGTSKEGAR